MLIIKYLITGGYQSKGNIRENMFLFFSNDLPTFSTNDPNVGKYVLFESAVPLLSMDI